MIVAIGVTAALAMAAALVLAWWYARQPVNQWGER